MKDLLKAYEGLFQKKDDDEKTKAELFEDYIQLKKLKKYIDKVFSSPIKEYYIYDIKNKQRKILNILTTE